MLVASLAASATASVAPYLYVRWKKGRRLLRLESQLPDAIDLIARAVRAGHPLSEGLRMASEEAPEPLASEFRITFEEQRFGLPFEDALLGLGDRVEVVDIRILITAILVQREVGGNLSEILEQIAETMRARFSLKRQVRVYTAQGRMSGYTLAALPIFVGLMISLINPDYMQTLFLRKPREGAPRRCRDAAADRVPVDPSHRGRPLLGGTMMMTYLVGVFAGLCVTLLLVALYELATSPARAVAREIQEIRTLQPSPFGSISRRRRQTRKEQLRDVVRLLGERVERGGLDVQGWGQAPGSGWILESRRAEGVLRDARGTGCPVRGREPRGRGVPGSEASGHALGGAVDGWLRLARSELVCAAAVSAEAPRDPVRLGRRARPTRRVRRSRDGAQPGARPRRRRGPKRSASRSPKNSPW